MSISKNNKNIINKVKLNNGAVVFLDNNKNFYPLLPRIVRIQELPLEIKYGSNNDFKVIDCENNIFNIKTYINISDNVSVGKPILIWQAFINGKLRTPIGFDPDINLNSRIDKIELKEFPPISNPETINILIANLDPNYGKLSYFIPLDRKII